jgi:hypothetical protein
LDATAPADRGSFDNRASWGAALRTGTAGSRDESPCRAIHKQRRYRQAAFSAHFGVPSCCEKPRSAAKSACRTQDSATAEDAI